MSSAFPTNSDDIIDSRDIIKRVAELESYEPEPQTVARFNELSAQTELTPEEEDELAELRVEVEMNDEEEKAELAALKELADEVDSNTEDWKYGVTLIRDDYFETYARDMAEDMGAIPENAAWPASCIDWERAARELQQDYTSVDFDGVTYWVR